MGRSTKIEAIRANTTKRKYIMAREKMNEEQREQQEHQQQENQQRTTKVQ